MKACSPTPRHATVLCSQGAAAPFRSPQSMCVCVCVCMCVCAVSHSHTHTAVGGHGAKRCCDCGHDQMQALCRCGVATHGCGYASGRVHVLWPRLPPSCTHPQETGLRVHDKRAHNAHGFATRTPQFVPKRRQARSSSPWGCVHTKVWTRQGFRELFFEHDCRGQRANRIGVG